MSADEYEAAIEGAAQSMNLVSALCGFPPIDWGEILRDVWRDFQPTFGLLIASTSGAADEFAYYAGGNQ
jgi:hypothetical protein